MCDTPDAAASSTYLDAQETSPNPFEETGPDLPHPLDLQSIQQRIAHRNHENTRRRIIDALHFTDEAETRKRAARLAACCCCPTFRCGGDRPIGVSLARCRDRLCPLCSLRRGVQAAAKILEIARSFDAPRLITLTLKATDEPLETRLRVLAHRFGLLRTLKGWKSRVTGGVWTVEITRNANTGHWHAHVHAIIDGEFFPQKLLRELWLQVTGDSFIVDVRAIHNRQEAARYVAKYLGKPADVAAWPRSAIVAFAKATHGKRLVQPFGSARNIEPDEDTEDRGSIGPDLLCTAHVLVQACSAGWEPALRAREILSRMGIDHAIASGIVPPTLSGTAAPVEDWETSYAVKTLALLQAHQPHMPPRGPDEPERDQVRPDPQLNLRVQTPPS